MCTWGFSQERRAWEVANLTHDELQNLRKNPLRIQLRVRHQNLQARGRATKRELNMENSWDRRG